MVKKISIFVDHDPGGYFEREFFLPEICPVNGSSKMLQRIRFCIEYVILESQDKVVEVVGIRKKRSSCIIYHDMGPDSRENITLQKFVR
jgi:hypothetical protein